MEGGFATGARSSVGRTTNLCYTLAKTGIQPMRRRDFLALTSAALIARSSLALAQRGRIPTVGVLWHAGSSFEEGAYFTGLIEGFQALGYVDGLNITLHHRFPNEMPERFRSMVALKVDVLVTVGAQTAPY